jgi:hypothetical protein
MQRVIELIRELVANRFWGELVVKFEGGKVVLVKKTENIKP